MNQFVTPHLKNYLQYYITLKKPRFGVLVTGAWGVGKTHQVRTCLPEEKSYYVSLFGIETVEQLHAEVFAVTNPKLSKASKGAGSVRKTLKDAGGLFTLGGGIWGAITNALLKKQASPDRPLIFDDLERSKLPTKSLQGAINYYIEHAGFQVVVIAHDEKLKKAFSGSQEKMFGQSLSVEPQTNSAFEAFVNMLEKPSTQDFVRKYRAEIVNTFVASSQPSLRILRHVIDDLSRLLENLRDDHLENREAIAHLVKLFCAFDIMVRSRIISKDDIEERQQQILDYNVQRISGGAGSITKPPTVVVSEMFPEIDLRDELLTNEVLVSMFIDGNYDATSIQTSIDRSTHFLKPSEAPPWRIVIGFDEIEDSVVKTALDRMREQFEKREATEPGEILHILSLRLMMSENKISEESFDDIVTSGKKYVDDLAEAGTLPAPNPRDRDTHIYNQGYAGHAYWVTDLTRPSFTELSEHLIAATDKEFEKRIPSIAGDLLELARTNAKAFSDMISQTSAPENPYANTAVLHGMDPSAFVDAWLSLPTLEWRTIKYAFDRRYEFLQYFESRFASERDWAISLHEELITRAEATDGFSALRIMRIIPEQLKKLVQTR